jgi:cytochrome c peroxidase
VGYNRWFNWDGGADSLWAQALGPIESSHEMASDRIRIVRLIIQDMELRSAYRQVFGQIHEILSLDSLPEFGRPNSGDKGSPEHNAWMRLENDEQHAVNSLFTNVAKAIAAFQETIISTQAPFDRFVEGLRTGAEEKLQAISLSAKRGMKLFFGKAKCSVCHAGPTLSDLEFHNTFLPQRDQWSKNDFGRYDGITKAKTAEFNSSSVYNDAAPSKYVDWTRYLTRTIEQRGQFKTPSLRNVARTAPYTHTGQFATLSEATGHCSDMDDAAGEDEHSEVIVSSLDLTASEKQDIVEFLMTLTDESFLARLDGNGHH